MTGKVPLEQAQALNYRALGGLSCDNALGASHVARELITLFRSGCDLIPEVREALACALERGLDGNRQAETNEFGRLMPYIELGGMGRDGTVNEAIAARRNWFDASEELERQRKQGRKGHSVIVEIGALFGLGFDGMKKANSFRNKFLAEIKVAGNSLVAETLNYMGDNDFDGDPSGAGETGGDHYFYARTLFIEREAEASCRKGI